YRFPPHMDMTKPALLKQCRPGLLVIDYWIGRAGSAAHSAMEPSYMRVFLLPRTSLSANQGSDAQWPVLQKVMFSSSRLKPASRTRASTCSRLAKLALFAS